MLGYKRLLLKLWVSIDKHWSSVDNYIKLVYYINYPMTLCSKWILKTKEHWGYKKQLKGYWKVREQR